MVKLRAYIIHPLLGNVIKNVVNDPALKGNAFYGEEYGPRNRVGDGYKFYRFDPSFERSFGRHPPLILSVQYLPHFPDNDWNRVDLELRIYDAVIAVVESDDLTPEAYEKQLYDAVRDGLVRSLREKNYITDESPKMIPAKSKLHWHAINRLANIIEWLQ